MNKNPFINIVALVVILLQASFLGADVLVKDSFDLDTSTRQAGQAFIKQNPTEQTLDPIAQWNIAGNWIMQEPGAIITQSHGGLSVNLEGGKDFSDPRAIQVQARINTGQSGWTCVSLGKEFLATKFFEQVELMLLLQPSGSYGLLINAKTYLVKGKLANDQNDPWHTLSLTYDPKDNTVSAFIDQQQIADRIALQKYEFTPTIQAAGVFVLMTKEACNAQVDDVLIQTVENGAKVKTSYWAPPRVDQFFISPNVPAQVLFAAAQPQGKLPQSVPFELKDYTDKSVATGQAKVTQDRTVSIPVNLPRGFYTLILDDSQEYGLDVVPEFQGNTDPFFCMDSGLGWLVVRKNHYTTYSNYEQTRDDMVAILKRVGVAKSRERISWGAMQVGPNEWNWQTDRQYDTLRDAYRKHGVPVLELSHSSPSFLGHTTGNRFPKDLHGTAQAWTAYHQRLGDSWGGLEMWNEANLSFGGNRPADQYAPMSKAIAYSLDQAQCQAPIGGPATAGGFDMAYLKNYADNGGLTSTDYYSFHTYSHAMAIEGIIEKHRELFAQYNQQSFPIWITESGRPWTKGQDRPSLSEERTSTVDNVMKAIESKACGVASYFVFVYPFYEENSRNFGLLDRTGSPLRPMAGYANAINMIANMQYIGDWTTDDSNIQRARVFANTDKAILVLYAPQIKDTDTVQVNLPANCNFYGIDGRELDATTTGTVPMPDGITFVQLPIDSLNNVNSQTPAKRLYELSRQKRQAKITSPIVMQFMPSEEVYDMDVKGYRIKADDSHQTVPLVLRLCNLGDTSEQITVKMQKNGQAFGQPVVVDLAAASDGQAQWDIPIAWRNEEHSTITFEAAANRTLNIAPVSIELIGELTFNALMSTTRQKQQIIIDDQTRWQMAAASECDPKMNFPGMGLCQIEARFEEGKDKWIFPRLNLGDDVSLQQYSGIAMEIKAVNTSRVHLFCWEKNADGKNESIGYLTPTSLISGDQQWHAVYIPFNKLVLSGSNAMDPNNKLDLDQIQRISPGFNGNVGQCSLEIRQAWLVTK